MVTHDPEEAMAVCHRVAVMKDGELHQCATPSALVKRPATSFVARFVLQRTVLPVEQRGVDWFCPCGRLYSVPPLMSISARELAVDAASFLVRPDASGQAIVKGREYRHTSWLLRVQVGRYLLKVHHPLASSLKPGERCSVSFRTGHTGILYPACKACVLG